MLLPSLAIVAFLSAAGLSGDAWGFPKYVAYAAPLAFAFVGGELAALASGPRSRWAAVALALLMVGSLAFQTAAGLRRPGGTLYLAGEPGFREAASALSANLGTDEVFLGNKDASFYADRKFLQWSGSLWTDVALLQQRVAEKQARLAAASAAQLAAASPEVASWLAEHAELIASPEDNRVYRIR